MHAFYLSINTNKYIFTGKKIEVSTEKCGAIIYCASEKKTEKYYKFEFGCSMIIYEKEMKPQI